MLCSAAWLPGDISWRDINRESSKMGPLGHGTLISSLDPSAGPQQQVWLASSMRGLGEGERSAQAQVTRESGESGFNSPNHGFEMEMGGEWKEGWRAVKIWWEATSFLYFPLGKNKDWGLLLKGKHPSELQWSPRPRRSAPKRVT